MTDEAQGSQGPEPPEVDLTGEAPVSGPLPSVDLTQTEPPSGAGLLPGTLLPIPYQRERRRGQIALLLVALLVAVVVLSFAALWFLPTNRFDSLMKLLQILFAPIIGLVGAVTGFYYGGGESRSGSGSNGLPTE
jgi:hypothetical protein